METVEQVQTSAASEFPAAEIPPQPAATGTPESQTLEPKHPAQDETVLTAEISELWRLHTDYAASMRSQSQNLRSLRAELGQKLAAMKSSLAKPGRAGLWSAWLKEHKIARATADRLVLRHERSLNPDGNCLTEAIPEPTEEQIQSLLDKVGPKLRRILRTPASAYCFLDLLSASFEGVQRRVTEQGILVLRPSSQMEVAKSQPVESPGEPVPVVAEVPVEAYPESADAR